MPKYSGRLLVGPHFSSFSCARCYDSNVTVLEVAQQILTELAAMQAQLNAMQTVLARIDVAVEGTPMTFVLAVT
jgi:hypothetical protein